METISLQQLTEEQKQALRNEMLAEEQAKKEAKLQAIQDYKTLVQATVTEQIKELMNTSSQLSLLKANVYKSFCTLIQLKNELYGSKSGQASHTFSDDMGNSITIGFRIIDKFDDTLDMGIAKVREFLDSLAIDENSSNLVDMINNLLKKDSKGNLKPNRILDLQNLAERQNSKLLTEGVEIIRKSYKPERSAIFVDCYKKDESGVNTSIQLSITAANFPDEDEIDFSVFK